MGLFSRNKSSQIADFSLLKTDMHSHLIPGVDDGARDMETSLELIRGMQELGYTKIITTPHILWDMYQNTSEIILEKLELLRTAVKYAGIDVEINAAAEYFLDDHVEELLKEKKPLLTIHKNWVLSEFSLAYPSHSLKSILFEMQMQGYQPVIAHPERYIYLKDAKDFYDQLKDIGCLFQLNLPSIGGYYGKSVQELAQYLIKKEYYDLIGTDLHNDRYLESLKNPALAVPLKKLCDSGKIRNLEM